jgi:hypothetical protein
MAPTNEDRQPVITEIRPVVSGCRLRRIAPVLAVALIPSPRADTKAHAVDAEQHGGTDFLWLTAC